MKSKLPYLRALRFGLCFLGGWLWAFEPNSVYKNDSERGRLNYRGRLIKDSLCSSSFFTAMQDLGSQK